MSDTGSQPNPIKLVFGVAALLLGGTFCIGSVAAIAIPAFSGYLSRAQTAEARYVLDRLHQGAATYYAQEHRGSDGVTRTACVVSQERTTNTPSSAQTTLEPPEGSSFTALGLDTPNPYYFQYEIVSPGGCGHPPGAALYSFRARGDLDDDGVLSLFELTTTSTAEGTLERAAEIREVQPSE